MDFAPTADAARCSEGPELAGFAEDGPAADVGVGFLGRVVVLEHAGGGHATPRVEALFEDAVSEDGEVLHEILADAAAGVGQAVGEFGGFAHQQETWRFKSAAGDDDGASAKLLLLTLGVKENYAFGAAVGGNGDFASHGLWANADAAGGFGFGDVGDIDACFSGDLAAQRAGAGVDASGAIVPIEGGDGQRLPAGRGGGGVGGAVLGEA